MKTNTLHSISIFCSSLAIAIFLVMVSAMGTAKAQNTLPNNLRQSAINGLFTPTAADRFFEQGRQQMEREADILANPERYYNDRLLQVNTIDIKIIDENGEPQPIPNFPEDSLENQME
ncbi:MAG: hypothetical protein QNJ60_13385 [Xenococcaceae cyanobacterium MO_188.B19]|nr:hypothetical protein [Xenococcaceae cyanobacterium MO_188.B19]